MKRGLNLTGLAQEIERQALAKKDLTAPARALVMNPDDTGDVTLQVGATSGRFGIKETAHQQLATYTKIPAPYYDRLRKEAPDLLAKNVNTWLGRSDDRRLVRVLDEHVRALLSDKYRPLENEDLAEAILPIVLDMGLEVVSCDVTDKNLYIKAVDQKINRDIPKGARMGDGSHHVFDTCAPALSIRNSEVGHGALVVESGMLTRACTNLVWFAQSGMKRRHVGARHELVSSDAIAELLSDETKRLTDRAIWSQVRDVVKGAFNEVVFDAQIDKIKGTTTQRIEGDPVEVVQFAAKRFGLTEGEGKSVLRHLIEGGGLTRYGLFNAVTRTAEDSDSYDRATDLERLGGTIIDLSPSQWRVVSNAEGDPLKAAA